MFDFENLRLSWKPNQFLMAPAGLCRHARPHTLSPTFDVPVARLREAFMAVAGRQPRTEITDESEKSVTLIQRSKTFRFPDIIDVRFVSLDPGRATFGVYSRARYGIRDFGVNRARIRDWLGQLHDELAD